MNVIGFFALCFKVLYSTVYYNPMVRQKHLWW